MANKRKGAAKVPKAKKDKVVELASLIDDYKTVCVVNMKGLPARQLQTIRNKIRDEAKIRMSKKSVMGRALNSCKNKHAPKLSEHLNGMPAFLFSNEDAFEVFRILKKNRSPAAAKVGQTAPKDIEIKEGPTSLTPGPAISTLSSAGLAAGVDQGKIAIKKAKVIINEGEQFEQRIVDALNLLNKEPMEIGIHLVVALQGGEVIGRKALDIDVDEYKQKIASAHSDSFRLAIGANIVTPDTASLLITRAELDARTLALEKLILNDDTSEGILAKIEGQARALQKELGSNK